MAAALCFPVDTQYSVSRRGFANAQNIHPAKCAKCTAHVACQHASTAAIMCALMMANEQKLPIAKIGKTTYNRTVYEPSDDSFALVDAFLQDQAVWRARCVSNCVEVGSGSGYVITSALLALQASGISPHSLAIDVTEEAVKATTATLHAHGLNGVDVVQCDLLSALRPALLGKLDLLFFNPPYVVTPDDEVSTTGISAAWAGGKDGRIVIDRLLETVHEFLSPSGLLYMIAVHDNRPDQLLRELSTRTGLHGDILLTTRADEELLYVLRISKQPVT